MEKPTQNELASTVYNWLSLAGIKLNSSYCKQQITTHTDYPAITSVTDFLDTGNMPYQAVQADASHIHEFNYPLIAHIKEPGNEYMHIIPNEKAWDAQKEITQHWSGIVVFPEKNASWKNEENTQATKIALQKNFLAAIGVCLGLTLFLWAALKSTSVLWNVFGLLSLFGLVVAFFILAAELGYQNKIVQQVCGAVSAGGCETVLQSKQAKNVFGFTPADAGLIYFATQFLAVLFAPFYPALVNIMYCLALAGIAVAGWSIYTQAIVIKKYCALCLALVAVLILQFATGLATVSFVGITQMPVIVYFVAVLLMAAILFPIKQLVKNNTKLQQKAAELRKWKTDAAIFEGLISREREVNTNIWENDLVLGNPSAPIRITVACNPYCGPCAKAHELLDTLLAQYPREVAVQVRLLCNPAEPSSIRTLATTALLKKAASIKDSKQLKIMLSDWFHLMDLKKWSKIWNPIENINIETELEAHHNWNEESNIRVTPTFFINGKALPVKYNIDDFQKILPDLAICQSEKILQ